MKFACSILLLNYLKVLAMLFSTENVILMEDFGKNLLAIDCFLLK